MHWQRATLPVSKSGLGVKSATLEAHMRRSSYERYLASLDDDGSTGSAVARDDPDKAAELGYQDVADILLDVLPPGRVRLVSQNSPARMRWTG